MASLFIKDSATADRATRLAKRLGITKTDVVRRSLEAFEDNLKAEEPKQDFVAWMEQFRRDNPLPPPTGLKADKAFFDWLSGEEDVSDVIR